METERPSSKPSRELIVTLALLIIIVVIASTAVIASHKKTSQGSGATSQTTQSTSTSNNASSYKDGTYTATGSYTSPGGQEAIKLSLTVKNNNVSESSVTRDVTTDDEAEMYQNDFISGYKEYVDGKPLNSISVSRVSGSSLTSQGFNDALAQIKSQARG